MIIHSAHSYGSCRLPTLLILLTLLTLVLRHFGPKTFRNHHTGAETCGQFSTSATVSHGHWHWYRTFSTSRKHFAPVQKKGLMLLLLKKTTDFIIIHKNTPTTTSHYTHVGKTTESVYCTVTGPCLHMRHRPSARRLYRFRDLPILIP